MFDVSFTELMVIGVIALIVIGPERLPKVARTVGHLLGRAQRYVSDVKGDIKREIELDELRKFKSEMEDAAQTVNTSLRETEASIRKSGSDLRSELDATARDAASAVKGDGTNAPDAQSNNVTHTSVATPDPLVPSSTLPLTDAPAGTAAVSDSAAPNAPLPISPTAAMPTAHDEGEPVAPASSTLASPASTSSVNVSAIDVSAAAETAGAETAKAPVAASRGNPVAPEPGNPAPVPAQNNALPPAPTPAKAASASAPSVSPTAAMPPIESLAHDTATAKAVEPGTASDAKASPTRGAAS